jgi:hypothetical protein
MRGARAAPACAALILPLLAAPLLALVPNAEAQDEACHPEGAIVRCVWEGEVPTVVPYDTALDAEGCPHERTLFAHPFRLPFPGRIELNVTLPDELDNFNDFLLYLDGPTGTVNRTYPPQPYPQTLNARILEPVDLVARVTMDGSLNSANHPVVPAPEHYRLEAILTPVTGDPNWSIQQEMVLGQKLQVGDKLIPKNAYAITCWDFGKTYTLPIDGPGIADLDMQFTSQGVHEVLPSDDVGVRLTDALGTTVLDLRAGPESGKLGFVAVEGQAWGDWLLQVLLDRRVGVGDPFEIHMNLTGHAVEPAKIAVPAPVVPWELLVADPRDDADDRTLDVLGGWFSDDTKDTLAFHMLVAEVPDYGLAPAPGEGARRYEASWTYAGSRVVVSHEAVRGSPASYHVALDGGDTQRVSAVPGRITPGTPGVLTFLLPKSFIGSPADGKALEHVAVRTYQFQDGPVPVRPTLVPPLPLELQGGSVLADETVDDVSYVVQIAALAPDDAPLVPATVGPAVSPWGALRDINSGLGLASGVLLGALGAIALAGRRGARR